MLWLVILLPITVSMLNRGVVHIVVADYMVDNYYFRFDREVVHIVVAGDIVDHYWLMFYRVVVHSVVAVTLLTITL